MAGPRSNHSEDLYEAEEESAAVVRWDSRIVGRLALDVEEGHFPVPFAEAPGPVHAAAAVDRDLAAQPACGTANLAMVGSGEGPNFLAPLEVTSGLATRRTEVYLRYWTTSVVVRR